MNTLRVGSMFPFIELRNLLGGSANDRAILVQVKSVLQLGHRSTEDEDSVESKVFSI